MDGLVKLRDAHAMLLNPGIGAKRGVARMATAVAKRTGVGEEPDTGGSCGPNTKLT